MKLVINKHLREQMYSCKKLTEEMGVKVQKKKRRNQILAKLQTYNQLERSG
jgi:hypothetical protein